MRATGQPKTFLRAGHVPRSFFPLLFIHLFQLYILLPMAAAKLKMNCFSSLSLEFTLHKDDFVVLNCGLLIVPFITAITPTPTPQIGKV